MRVLTGRKVALRSLAFSADGAKLAAGGDRGNVQVWNLRTGQRSRHYLLGDTPVRSVFWLAPDKLAALVPFVVRVIDLDDGRVASLGAGVAPEGHGVIQAAPSPDARSLAAANFLALGRYALPAGEKAWDWYAATTSNMVTALAWSADGRVIAAGSHSGVVRLFDAATGAVTVTADDFGRAAVTAVALSPDGAAVASCAGRHLHLRRPSDGVRVHHTLGKTHFLGVAFHPSGGFFATANGDGAIDFWDARTGERRESFDWKVGKLHGVTFDAAGDRAACCGAAGQVVVWDIDREGPC